jgi:hypothetical protein
MAITFQCSCGRTLRVKDELAGRRVRCPNCSSIVTASESDLQYDAANVSITDKPSDAGYEFERDEPEVPASSAVTDRPGDRVPAPMKKRRPASKRERKKESWQAPVIYINAEVATGFVMIVVAIAWFVAGLLWLHRIFFYPGVLVILGIGAIVKGFTAPK